MTVSASATRSRRTEDSLQEIHASRRGVQLPANPNTAKFKQFGKDSNQLLQEGVIQALYLRNSAVKDTAPRRRRTAAV